MSIHQIIYTSCKRGIRGVNDGQQIFSYDRAFPEGSIDEVKGMFTYIMPALEPGVIMTEELATTMPQAFLYRRLPSGKGAMALNTYLGRDYMGAAGRFGNQLSHVILCDPGDLEDYPCRFFGSDAFRSRMEFEEVNNPGQPDYLPRTQLTTGPLDVERVTDFLSQEDRMPVYLNMLWAMLAFRSQRKRLVICDRQEHIPCWIAALEFALPLSMALDINFTTYEYDPSLSEAQICGVVPRGTRFDPMNAPQHFTFDLLGGNCPEFPEKDPEFFDFVDTALSFSYDSLQDFHGFLTRTGYDKADEGIYDAYALYTLLSDGPGDFDRERLQRAVDFAERSGKETLCDRLTAMLLDNTGFLFRAPGDLFRVVRSYLGRNAAALTVEQSRDVKELLVDRVLSVCLDTGTQEQQFREETREDEELCRICGSSLVRELMAGYNRKKLLGIMSRDLAGWKKDFLLHVVKQDVKERNLSAGTLEPGQPVFEIYVHFLRAMGDVDAGTALARDILKTYETMPEHMAVLALSLNQTLNQTQGMLDVWYETVLRGGLDRLEQTWEFLARRLQSHRAWELYTLAMERTQSPQQAQELFTRKGQFLDRWPEYAMERKRDMAERYLGKLGAFAPRPAYGCRQQLMERLREEPELLLPKSIYELEKDLLVPISWGGFRGGETRLVAMLSQFNGARGMKSPRKLVALTMGRVFETARSEKELAAALEKALTMGRREVLELDVVSPEDSGDYLEWILPHFCDLCLTRPLMERVLNCIRMNHGQEQQAMLECSRIYLKDSRRDIQTLTEFLGVALQRGTEETHKELGRLLKKLGKGRLEELDREISSRYAGEQPERAAWSVVMETAQAKPAVLENLTSLFRRKPKE